MVAIAAAEWLQRQCCCAAAKRQHTPHHHSPWLSLKMFFLRSMMRSAPPGVSSPTSPVWNQPSESMALRVSSCTQKQRPGAHAQQDHLEVALSVQGAACSMPACPLRADDGR